MKIAITGGSGGVGRYIVATALAQGHSVVSIDRAIPAAPSTGAITYVTAELADYNGLLRTFAGCDALIHLAAIPYPFEQPDHVVHNNNVVGSYNAMRAAIETGIKRICQASSVNAIGLSFSRQARFDYFPVDEQHPDHNEEPYGLSKWICEAQADSLARRYEDVAIASLRFHLVVEKAASAIAWYNTLGPDISKHLWAYTSFDAIARAALLSLTADFTGHETFYIVAPETVSETPSLELAARYYPNVPIRGDLTGHRSFFDSGKAERLLGWRH